jgi:hypothetical protein
MTDEDMPKNKDDEVVVVEKDGGYAMTSSRRIRRGAHKGVLDNWNADLDREAGDNDPHKRR